MKYILTIFLILFSIPYSHAWKPTEPVNIYIGAGPGTTAELALRKVTNDITKRTGVTFIFNYRPGPGQIEVTNNFMNMPRDGHHLLMPFFGDVFIWSEILHKDRVKWNVDSFDYIIGLPSDPAVFIAPINSEINNPQQLFNYFKEKKNNINFGTATGTQSIPFYALLDYTKADNKKVKEIRYKAAREVMMDVASGNLDFGIIPAGLIKTAENTGRIKVIGITSENILSNGDKKYPTFNNEEFKLVFYIYRVVVLPSGTDKAIIDWYNNNMRMALENLEISKSFEDNFETIQSNYLTPEGIKSVLLDAKVRYQPLIRTYTQTLVK